ncbi:hypothetical protein N7501_007766 [Penicillium viridicatum]|nr:hypothetical protein N7501_007766 [Penicillium viridicatum]
MLTNVLLPENWRSSQLVLKNKTTRLCMALGRAFPDMHDIVATNDLSSETVEDFFKRLPYW